uniref:Craniofacial development protein 2-like n=1 Tax=Nicotiana tabacum TaxID=4097 RepID=A0A1S3YAM3_TOBAC|nr:PREDICTED: craniofacial development protein 2-like [Nicotiana tabacum]
MYKLWYSGRSLGKNEVGILVDRDLRELVVDVKRVNDRLMVITLSMISTYAPQASLDEQVNRLFWEDLDEMVPGIPHTEKFFIGGDFNGHTGKIVWGYDDVTIRPAYLVPKSRCLHETQRRENWDVTDDVHCRFDFGVRNEGGDSLLNFAKAFDLVVVNSCFQKKEDRLVTFWSMVAKTQIEYLLCRKRDRGLCTDCKVLPSEWLSTQHRLL